MLGSNQYYLIDHEHTFALTTEVEPRQIISQYNFKKHIFYNVLNRKATHGNEPEFGNFREYFHRANLDVFDSYAEALRDKGYEIDDSLVIKQYLQELKRDISYFMTIVKGGIQ